MKCLNKTQQTAEYLKDGRLADVMALIQVLVLDKDIHRSEQGFLDELQSKPQSASTWIEVASKHPEFFRVNQQNSYPVSLIARHVTTTGTNNDSKELPFELLGQLLQAAISLHDRQVARAEWWTHMTPIYAALISAVCSLLGVTLGLLFAKSP
jgi:hypothetical protein